jgi:hypothetical protein
VEASEEGVWLVFDFSCTSGCADSAGVDEVDWLVSFVSEDRGCGGTGVLGAGVVLQAASHSPARKVDINITDLILYGDIFNKKIGSGCCQSEVITASNIRFCQSCVKPGAWVPGDTT